VEKNAEREDLVYPTTKPVAYAGRCVVWNT